MSVKTIQCRLVTTEATRRDLWELMTEKHTPLVNELLQRIAQDSHFQEWCDVGKIPLATASETCKQLKQEPRFEGQPGRFYSSATTTMHRIFKSWLALQTRLRNQVAGQTRWLAILQSDEELTTVGQCDLHTLRAKASELLTQLTGSTSQTHEPNPEKNRGKEKKKQAKQSYASISKTFFDLYWETEETLSRCAIAYLLKNGCKLPERDEDPKKFAKRRRKVEIRLERVTNTLQRTRIPKGRDLSWRTWLETLDKAEDCVPVDENQAADWQAKLLNEPAVLPFPVNYETNEDLHWFLNETGRLCVTFNGLGEHTFVVYCDQRQLHWFKRFLEDQEIKRSGEKQHSASLFSLRSGRITWQQGTKEGDPWNGHRLVLSCAIETDTWTQEGTERIRREKADKCAKIIASTRAKKKSKQESGSICQKTRKNVGFA